MKTRNRHALLNLAIAGLLVGGLGVSTTTLADTAGNAAIGADNSLSSTEAERVMSRSAAKVLLHIAKARGAIHAKDFVLAKKELEQARFTLDALKTDRPTAKTHTHIQIARQHLKYENTDKVLADLVPIEEDLTEIATFYPVGQVKLHVDAARKHLKAGDKAGAKAELIAADAVLIYSEFDLPLSSTEHQVALAQKALEANKPKQAEQALQRAEGGVLFVSQIVASPALQARDSLWAAKQDYAEKNYAAARRDLDKADFWLAKLAKSSDKNTRDEAASIKAAAEDLAKKVEHKADGLGKSLEGIWERGMALAEREAEKASIGWKDKRPDADIRADLIDAKQRVAFAENLQFNAMADPADVFKALDQAKTLLTKASGSSPFDDRARFELKKAIKEIGMIHDTLNRRGLYEIVRARLRGLIHNHY